MMINKVYKFRLYPSDMQKIVIHKTFGCNKLLYNKMLSLKKEENNLTSFDIFLLLIFLFLLLSILSHFKSV